jgi:adenine deaminase
LIARRIAVARGDEPADLVLTGGRVFSVFTREWIDADIAIVDGFIAGLGTYEGRQTIDVRDAYVVPGFIDAHVHIESSKLMVDQFSRAVLPHGTTTVVADPHEIANVLGTDGVHWLLDACAHVPLDIFVMAPSCVPASPLESPRRPLSEGDLEGLLRRNRVIGIAEMMNFPGVIAGSSAELAKLQTGLTEHVDGHAPGVEGRALNAYIAAGIASDHECATYDEALAKRRLGMWVMLREGSAARNLADLLPIVRDLGPERCMFCTDDREPVFLVDEGHIDQMLRVAVERGVRAEDALVMATLNAAQYHGLAHLGAIAPGYQADIVVLDDLSSFKPRLVLKKGVEPIHETIEIPEWVRQTVNIGPLDDDRLAVRGPAHHIRVMRVIPGQLITGTDVMEPSTRDGELVADPRRDLVKIAVVERHHASGRAGVGFATNVGLQRGAFASTVAHDAHNVVVLGVDDRDMVLCVRRLAEIGGGIVVAEGGEVKGELALPIAGLMSDAPLDAVHEEMLGLESLLRQYGVTWEAPFMCLSFLALSVIPELKITDRGLVDVKRFEVVPLKVD